MQYVAGCPCESRQSVAADPQASIVCFFELHTRVPHAVLHHQRGGRDLSGFGALSDLVLVGVLAVVPGNRRGPWARQSIGAGSRARPFGEPGLRRVLRLVCVLCCDLGGRLPALPAPTSLLLLGRLVLLLLLRAVKSSLSSLSVPVTCLPSPKIALLVGQPAQKST